MAIDYTAKICKMSMMVAEKKVMVDNAKDEATDIYLDGVLVSSAPAIPGDISLGDIANGLGLSTDDGITNVTLWISMNADKSETFITMEPAIEPDRTVVALQLWAYSQWQRRQPPKEENV